MLEREKKVVRVFRTAPEGAGSHVSNGQNLLQALIRVVRTSWFLSYLLANQERKCQNLSHDTLNLIVAGTEILWYIYLRLN